MAARLSRIMTIHVSYSKPKVIQALRYHFISRPEVRILLILVNVFALASAALFYFKKIQPFAFMIGSFLWFTLMLTFWFFLPRIVYRKSSTFKEEIDITFYPQSIDLGTSRGHATWTYDRFSYFIESPHFFHLYINERSFFLIPKDCCIGEMDVKEVRDILKAKIGLKSK
jgi:hypothetical protein